MPSHNSNQGVTPQDMLQLNRPKSIVPPMKNVVGNTYAETRAEMKAKQRAEEEAQAALLRAQKEAAEKPRRSTLWLGVLTIVFLVIALAGSAFGVIMYSQNTSLLEANVELQNNYKQAKAKITELESAYTTAQERLNAFLEKEQARTAE